MNPEQEVAYAVAMHGHRSEREALADLAAKVDRVTRVLMLIERAAGDQSEHPAHRCLTIALLAQLGGYYAAGIGGEIELAISAAIENATVETP